MPILIDFLLFDCYFTREKTTFKNIFSGNYNPGLFWIGASDLASEGNWLWLPSKQKFSYSNWAPTEPDNINYYEHCALIDLHRGYKWSDDNCEERRNFICETIPNDEGNEVIGK